MGISIEQVEKLKQHADVTYEEAKLALEQADGDLLEAMIILEKEGKTKDQNARSEPRMAADGTVREGAEPDDMVVDQGTDQNNDGFQGHQNARGSQGHQNARGSQRSGDASGTNGSNDYDRSYEKTTSSFGDQMNRLWKAFLRLLHRGNINQFEVYKDGKSVLSVPVTVLVLALIFFFWVTLPLLVVFLFLGYKYRFNGPDLGKDNINGVMDSAYETAENIKKSAKESTAEETAEAHTGPAGTSTTKGETATAGTEPGAEAYEQPNNINTTEDKE